MRTPSLAVGIGIFGICRAANAARLTTHSKSFSTASNTGGRADLRELVPVALVVTSAVSLVVHTQRGRLPRWDSALYHAYRIFMQWHRTEVKDRESSTDESAKDESPER